MTLMDVQSGELWSAAWGWGPGQDGPPVSAASLCPGTGPGAADGCRLRQRLLQGAFQKRVAHVVCSS